MISVDLDGGGITLRLRRQLSPTDENRDAELLLTC